jgi:hypothetical protein
MRELPQCRALQLADNHCMKKLESAARQVWQEFSPRDGEDLAFGANNIIEVTIGGGTEGFDMDPDRPFGELVSALADRLQTIIMEDRQQMIPDCPLHPAAHPLESHVVGGAAAWVCPPTKRVVRYMRVTTGAA